MSSNDSSVVVRKLIETIAKNNNFHDYSLDIRNELETGDGHMSKLARVAITEKNSEKRLDLVCKMGPQSERHRQEYLTDLLFAREALFYDKLMPILAKFQEEKNVPNAEQFLSYPKCYATLIDPENGHCVIILEDLREKGFKMWNKAEPLPSEVVRLYLRELGKFHGLSIAMKDQKPDEFAEFKQVKDLMKMFMGTKNNQEMFKGTFERASNSLENANHKALMRHMKDNFMSYVNECLDDEASDRFGFLCHGDFWNNNMLFKLEKNAAEEVRFIDWQLTRYMSPVTDIAYNLFISTDKSLRDAEFDSILEHYYESLSKMVKLLGSDPEKLFTFENLKDELKRCANLAMIIAPLAGEVFQPDSSEITKLSDEFEKIGDGNETMRWVSGLSEEGRFEYERRLSDILADVIRLDYYHKVE